MLILWVLVALLVVAQGYVRLAPSDSNDWHQMPEFSADKNFKKGVLRIVETGADGLSRMDVIARGTPRTEVLAGTVEDGMVTYITRTPVFGFPDYTTVQQDGETIRIYARLRFGRADSGVNRKRVETWLTALQAGG